MSDTTKVLLGVQKALARTGAQCTITRKTTTRDPSNPTKPIVSVLTYTMPGLVYPKTQYEPASASLITRTMFIPDLLGVEDTRAPGVKLNSLSSITWYTQVGDELTSTDGRRFKLLENEQPQLVGATVACLHQATIL
ncbi:hypothetical protein ACR2VJ_27535 [Klebsiella pneumoniae]